MTCVGLDVSFRSVGAMQVGGHELLVDDFFVHEFLRLAGHSLLIICKSGRRPRLDTFVWRKV